MRIIVPSGESIERRLRNVVAVQLGVAIENVTPEASVESLGYDSIDSVELVIAIEQEFQIEISDADAGKLDTVGLMLTYLNALAEKQVAGQ